MQSIMSSPEELVAELRENIALHLTNELGWLLAKHHAFAFPYESLSDVLHLLVNERRVDMFQLFANFMENHPDETSGWLRARSPPRQLGVVEIPGLLPIEFADREDARAVHEQWPIDRESLMLPHMTNLEMYFAGYEGSTARVEELQRIFHHGRPSPVNALRGAIRGKQYDMCAYLLDRHKGRFHNDRRLEKLVRSLVWHDQDMLQFLLQHGVDVNDFDLLGESISGNDAESVELCLDHGARVHNRHMNSFSIYNEEFDETITILRLLLDRGIDVNSRDERGETYLYRLARRYPSQSNLIVIGFLIKVAHADPYLAPDGRPSIMDDRYYCLLIQPILDDYERKRFVQRMADFPRTAPPPIPSDDMPPPTVGVMRHAARMNPDMLKHLGEHFALYQF